MHINQLKSSKFLRKEDCGKGVLLTIDRLEEQNVAMTGQPQEMKYCVVFQEDVKPLVLNNTNSQLIASITGSEETDDWHGHQIVAYTDPTVMNKGVVTGGIRVRAPKRQPAVPATPSTPAPAPRAPTPKAPAPAGYEEEDDVPF